jgi:hypothetical protein
MNDLFLLEEFIKEALIDEARKKKRKKRKSKKKSTKYPSQYKAKGKRRKKLDTATRLAKSDSEADRQRAYKMRDRMEKSERKKKGFKNVPRHDSKK